MSSIHRKALTMYIILLAVFAIIFFLAFLGLQSNKALFSIGIPAEFENWLIMILCIASIAKIVYELHVWKKD